MKRSIVIGFVLFEFCLVVPIIADQNPPAFVFGGNRVYVGMSKRDAETALLRCCKLSPPADSDVEKHSAPRGVLLGHRILGHLISPEKDHPTTCSGRFSFLGIRLRV